MDLQTLIQTIVPLDQPAMDAALRRQAELAKPPGSLGRLESLSVQIAGITGKLDNQIHDNALLVFAADNGVVAEGVSSCAVRRSWPSPREVWDGWRACPSKSPGSQENWITKYTIMPCWYSPQTTA